MPLFQPAPSKVLTEWRIANNSTDPTNDIDFIWTEFRELPGGYREQIATGTITKRLDASWVAGTGNGGLDTGSVTNTTYHCYGARNAAGVKDAFFSTSLTPTAPGGFSFYKRVGSITRVSGANRAFTQIGKYFQFPTRIRALDGHAVSTAGELIAMPVPVGIRVKVKGILSPGQPPTPSVSSVAYLSILLLDGDLSGTVTSSNAGITDSIFDATVSTRDQRGANLSNDILLNANATLEMPITNTSGQLYFRRSGSYAGASSQTTYQVHGYEDFLLL